MLNETDRILVEARVNTLRKEVAGLDTTLLLLQVRKDRVQAKRAGKLIEIDAILATLSAVAETVAPAGVHDDDKRNVIKDIVALWQKMNEYV